MNVTESELRGQRDLFRTTLDVAVYSGQSFDAAQWPRLSDPSDLHMHVYQSREFLEVWINTIGKVRGIESLLIVVSDQSGRRILYLPLAIETRFNVRMLCFMDAGVADYNAPILAPGATLSDRQFQELWQKILMRLPNFDVVDLRKMPHDVLGLPNPLRFLNCVPHSESGHSTSLQSLRCEVDARPSVVRLRKDLRRHHRRLSNLGTTEFVMNPSGADLTRVAERLIDLKRKRYARTTGHDFLAMSGIGNFYREMMSASRPGQISQLSALTSGGEVVSAHLGFLGRERFYYVFPAFDIGFRQFRVGHMLIQHLIDYSYEQRLGTFDFGVGDFPYKNTWETQRLALYSHERAVTAAGHAYLLLRRARSGFRKLRARAKATP